MANLENFAIFLGGVMDKYSNLIQGLKKLKIINLETIEKLYGEVDRSYLYFLANKLQEDKILKKLGVDVYEVLSEKREYVYKLSKKAQEIANSVLQNFPLVDIRIYETRIFNEFVNHQISQNVIFVEVERGLGQAVFEKLSELFGKGLLKPKLNDYRLYGENGIFIIRSLLSESPLNKENNYQLTLEKMMVDLYVDELLQVFVSKNEYEKLLEYCYSNYIINERKLLRYAARRNAKEKINKVINEVKGKI